MQDGAERRHAGELCWSSKIKIIPSLKASGGSNPWISVINFAVVQITTDALVAKSGSFLSTDVDEWNPRPLSAMKRSESKEAKPRGGDASIAMRAISPFSAISGIRSSSGGNFSLRKSIS
jgi:hypothetical protein